MNIGFDAKRIFHNSTGLGNYSREIVKTLSTEFPQHQYYLYNPKPSKKGLYYPKQQHVVEKLPVAALDSLFYNLWRQRNIVHDLKRDGIKLFHGLSGEIPMGLAAHNIRSVVTIHDLIFVRFPQFFKYIDRNIYFKKFKAAAEHADQIIAISEQTKNDVMQFLGAPEEKITVVYQSCDSVFKQKYDHEQKWEVAKKYDLPERFILSVGTVETRKNLLTVVKAMKNIDAHLVVVGSTKSKYAAEVLDYIRTERLGVKITFLKGVSNEELAMIYQLATVFVYPSLFEGFGIPIIEALYSRTPVITTQEGCFKEAAGPGALYARNPLDVADMESKIDLLLKNDNVRLDLADKGHKFVQKFKSETIADEIMSVYGKT